MPKEVVYTCLICGSKFLEDVHFFTYNENTLKIQAGVYVDNIAEQEYLCRNCIKDLIGKSQ